MGDGSPCRKGCQGGAAGIGEEVQHLRRPAGLLDPLPDQAGAEVPVHCLLRKDAGVLEGKGLQVKMNLSFGFAGKNVIRDAPLFGKIEEFPLSASLLGTVIVGVGALPARQAPLCVPDHLGVRPHQLIGAPALQLFSGGGVQHLIVFPSVCDPHVFTCPGRLSPEFSPFLRF